MTPDKKSDHSNRSSATVMFLEDADEKYIPDSDEPRNRKVSFVRDTNGCRTGAESATDPSPSLSRGKQINSRKKDSRPRDRSLKQSVSVATLKRARSKLLRANDKDDEGLKKQSPAQILKTMGFTAYYILSVAVLMGWSCICAWGTIRLSEEAERNPGGQLELWMSWIAEVDVKVIGSLFTFSLVFRFNQCYRRWWEGRVLWGNIIHECIDFSQQVSTWVIHEEYADRLNRLIIVFPYACKAQLRGVSLADPSEAGAELVKKGLLTEEELSYMQSNPAWQPQYFLHLIRTTVARVFIEEYTTGKTLFLPKANKIHEKLFSPMERQLNDLARNIGDCISIRSAGLPKSYDLVHYVFFWIYFILAPVTWSVTTGWMAPILVGLSASIIMTLINMGSSLVDPFGTDMVDLPLERFCESIEAQVLAIQFRSKEPELVQFAESSNTRFVMPKKGSEEMKSSYHINLR